MLDQKLQGRGSGRGRVTPLTFVRPWLGSCAQCAVPTLPSGHGELPTSPPGVTAQPSTANRDTQGAPNKIAFQFELIRKSVAYTDNKFHLLKMLTYELKLQLCPELPGVSLCRPLPLTRAWCWCWWRLESSSAQCAAHGDSHAGPHQPRRSARPPPAHQQLKVNTGAVRTSGSSLVTPSSETHLDRDPGHVTGIHQGSPASPWWTPAPCRP